MKAHTMDNLAIHSQRGAATLVISIVALLLVTLITLTTSKTVLMEQKISSNEARSKQAFEAAETGVNELMGYLQNSPNWDYVEGLGVGDDFAIFDTSSPADGVPNVNSGTLANGSSYSLTLGSGTNMASDPPVIVIQSAGLSDDLLASRTITYMLKFDNPNYYPTENPLLNRGSATLSGSANIYNPEGHSTIWSGDDIDLGGADTWIADPSDPNYPGCMDDPMSCRVIKSSTGANVGLDVVEHDSSLADLSSDEFFENFFGSSKEVFKLNTAKQIITAANVANDWDPDSATSGVHLATNQTLWVEGDADITANKRIGCSSTTQATTPYAFDAVGAKACPAADIEPGVLVINGDADFRGGVEIYGIVYVTGDLTIHGSVRVEGAIVVEGTNNTAAGGSLDVWYNTDVLSNTDKTGNIGGGDGGWRDF